MARAFRFIFRFTIISFILGLAGLVGLYMYVRSELPTSEAIKDVQLQTPMKVFSADGELISQFGEKKRLPVKANEIPVLLKQAVLATEDARFYEHPGIDVIGIFRAAFVLITTGQKKQGASTITMQLARNFFLTREKAYLRKVKEIFIALHIESLLTKEEILTLYLNKIELGHRAFGVAAAAEVYYGTTLDKLTLPQIAMIAGLPKAPSTLNPISRPTRAKARRGVVLGRMFTTGVITRAQFKAAVEAPLTAKKHGVDITLDAPYIAEMVREEMVSRYGKETAYNSGFKVYTTTPAKLQRAGQQAVVENLHDYDRRHGYRGAEEHLWQTQDHAWDAQQIIDYLQPLKRLQNLEPAVVVEVLEQAVWVQTTKEQIQLDWDALVWARPYLNDEKQGPVPQMASDILAQGDRIWIRKTTEDKYRLTQVPQASSALVSLDPNTGAVRALVGGYDFSQSEFNRATQAKRQVGSNIKPFVYSAALENGFTLASIVNDAPINEWDQKQGVAWRPKNSPPVYSGPTRVRVALARSKNVVSVRIFRSLGIEKVINYLSNFGFNPNELPRNESLSLGSASMTPLELATGYTMLANGGYSVAPYLIERIENSQGDVIWKATPKTVCEICERYYADELELGDQDLVLPERIVPQEQLANRVISKQNAFLMQEAMKSTISGGGSWTHKTGWNGTGWRAQRLKRKDISGKTGTTNEARDTWFSGFTPDLVTTAWVGFDDHNRILGRSAAHSVLKSAQSSGSEAGALTALPAWIRYMKVALPDFPQRPVVIPEDIVTARIDLDTGKLARVNDYTSRFEYFISGTQPTEAVAQNDLPDDENLEEGNKEEIF